MSGRQKTLYQAWYKDPTKSSRPPNDSSEKSVTSKETSLQRDEDFDCANACSLSNVPGSLPGFDADAGKTWIYPTNFPVRSYQFSIVREALFKNTMVVLPTGLGKTFIAAVVMFNIYRWYPEGKVVFMAPTRPLVAQQQEACMKITGIPEKDTIIMTGTTMPERRVHSWKQKRVFFLTPQTLANDLVRNICPAQCVKCLVIDEAHKALGNHAYCEVIHQLLMYTTEFRVLALTATPGNDTQAVKQVISNLLISHVELRTEDSEDVKPYSHVRNVEKIVVPLGDDLNCLKNKFLDIINIYLKRLTMRKALSPKNPASMSKYQILKLRDCFRDKVPADFNNKLYGLCMADFSLCISLYHAYELLLMYGVKPFYHFLADHIVLCGSELLTLFLSWVVICKVMLFRCNLQMSNVASRFRFVSRLISNISSSSVLEGDKSVPYARAELLKNFEFEELLQMIKEKYLLGGVQEALCLQGVQGANCSSPQKTYQFVAGHPKLKKMEEILLEHFKKFSDNSSSGTRVIIFSQYRDSVSEIEAMLKTHDPFIRAMSFVGQASKAGSGITQKRQLEVVRKFREGGFNTLVATCVAEEGLDIGEVDLIICYDCQRSPIRLIQRMGRTGRLREGRVVILLAEGKEEQVYKNSENQKKCIFKAVKGGLSFADFYQNSSRLVPFGVYPSCLKMEIEVQPRTATAAKRTSSSSAATSVLNQHEKSYFMQHFQYPGDDTPVLKSMSFATLKCEKDQQTKEVPYDSGCTQPKLNLHGWRPWQTTLQRTFRVSHSSKSRAFVEITQFAQFPETLPDYSTNCNSNGHQSVAKTVKHSKNKTGGKNVLHCLENACRKPAKKKRDKKSVTPVQKPVVSPQCGDSAVEMTELGTDNSSEMDAEDTDANCKPVTESINMEETSDSVSIVKRNHTAYCQSSVLNLLGKYLDKPVTIRQPPDLSSLTALSSASSSQAKEVTDADKTACSLRPALLAQLSDIYSGMHISKSPVKRLEGKGQLPDSVCVSSTKNNLLNNRHTNLQTNKSSEKPLLNPGLNNRYDSAGSHKFRLHNHLHSAQSETVSEDSWTVPTSGEENVRSSLANSIVEQGVVPTTKRQEFCSATLVANAQALPKSKLDVGRSTSWSEGTDVCIPKTGYIEGSGDCVFTTHRRNKVLPDLNHANFVPRKNCGSGPLNGMVPHGTSVPPLTSSNLNTVQSTARKNSSNAQSSKTFSSFLHSNASKPCPPQSGNRELQSELRGDQNATSLRHPSGSKANNVCDVAKLAACQSDSTKCNSRNSTESSAKNPFFKSFYSSNPPVSMPEKVSVQQSFSDCVTRSTELLHSNSSGPELVFYSENGSARAETMQVCTAIKDIQEQKAADITSSSTGPKRLVIGRSHQPCSLTESNGNSSKPGFLGGVSSMPSALVKLPKESSAAIPTNHISLKGRGSCSGTNRSASLPNLTGPVSEGVSAAGNSPPAALHKEEECVVVWVGKSDGKATDFQSKKNYEVNNSSEKCATLKHTKNDICISESPRKPNISARDNSTLKDSGLSGAPIGHKNLNSVGQISKKSTVDNILDNKVEIQSERNTNRSAKSACLSTCTGNTSGSTPNFGTDDTKIPITKSSLIKHSIAGRSGDTTHGLGAQYECHSALLKLQGNASMSKEHSQGSAQVPIPAGSSASAGKSFASKYSCSKKNSQDSPVSGGGDGKSNKKDVLQAKSEICGSSVGGSIDHSVTCTALKKGSSTERIANFSPATASHSLYKRQEEVRQSDQGKTKFRMLVEKHQTSSASLYESKCPKVTTKDGDSKTVNVIATGDSSSNQDFCRSLPGKYSPGRNSVQRATTKRKSGSPVLGGAKMLKSDPLPAADTTAQGKSSRIGIKTQQCSSPSRTCVTSSKSDRIISPHTDRKYSSFDLDSGTQYSASQLASYIDHSDIEESTAFDGKCNLPMALSAADASVTFTDSEEEICPTPPRTRALSVFSFSSKTSQASASQTKEKDSPDPNDAILSWDIGTDDDLLLSQDLKLTNFTPFSVTSKSVGEHKSAGAVPHQEFGGSPELKSAPEDGNATTEADDWNCDMSFDISFSQEINSCVSEKNCVREPSTGHLPTVTSLEATASKTGGDKRDETKDKNVNLKGFLYSVPKKPYHTQSNLTSNGSKQKSNEQEVTNLQKPHGSAYNQNKNQDSSARHSVNLNTLFSVDNNDNIDFKAPFKKTKLSRHKPKASVTEKPWNSAAVRRDTVTSAARKLKRLSGKDYILEEVDVSGDDDDQSDVEHDESSMDDLEASFIDDATHLHTGDESRVDDHALYLRSVKNCAGQPKQYKLKFSPWNGDILSQVETCDIPDYIRDSFCVDDDEVVYVSSDDDISKVEKKTKKKKKKRKRIMLVDSSHSEDDLERSHSDKRHENSAGSAFVKPTSPSCHQNTTRMSLYSQKPLCDKSPVAESSHIASKSHPDVDNILTHNTTEKHTSVEDEAFAMSFDIDWDDMVGPTQTSSPVNSRLDKGASSPSCTTNSSCGKSPLKTPVVFGRSPLTDRSTNNISAGPGNSTSTPSNSFSVFGQSLSVHIGRKSETGTCDTDSCTSLTILVSSRELARGKSVISDLRVQHKTKPFVMQLPDTDYVVSNRVSVTRILISDFVPHANMAKTMRKVKAMKELYEKCCVIIEKDSRAPVAANCQKDSRHHLEFAIIVFRYSSIKVLYSSSPSETAKFLYELTLGEKKRGMHIDVPTELDKRKQHMFQFYMSLPHVSPMCALNFTHNFKTVGHFLKSTPKELEKCGSISDSRAHVIHRYLNSCISV